MDINLAPARDRQKKDISLMLFPKCNERIFLLDQAELQSTFTTHVVKDCDLVVVAHTKL